MYSLDFSTRLELELEAAMGSGVEYYLWLWHGSFLSADAHVCIVLV